MLHRQYQKVGSQKKVQDKQKQVAASYCFLSLLHAKEERLEQ